MARGEERHGASQGRYGCSRSEPRKFLGYGHRLPEVFSGDPLSLTSGRCLLRLGAAIDTPDGVAVDADLELETLLSPWGQRCGGRVSGLGDLGRCIFRLPLGWPRGLHLVSNVLQLVGEGRLGLGLLQQLVAITSFAATSHRDRGALLATAGLFIFVMVMAQLLGPRTCHAAGQRQSKAHIARDTL